MGTRGTIQVLDNFTEEPLVNIYRQYDCYLTGLGADIKKMLNDGDVTIINGISGGAKNPSHFNGMGCLAAYMVREMKDGIGGVYLQGPQSKESYNYVLYADGKNLNMKVEVFDRVIFNGLLAVFDAKKLSEEE